MADKKIILELDVKTESARKHVDELNKSIKESTEITKRMVKQKQTETETYKKEVKVLSTLKQSQKDATKVLKTQEKERQKALNVIEKQRQKTLALVAAANKEVKTDADLAAKLRAQINLRQRVDKTTAKGRAEYNRMTGSIQKMDAAVKKNNASVGRHQGNVGKYPKIMGAAVAAAGAAIMAFRMLSSAVGASVDAFLVQEDVSLKVTNTFGDFADSINAAADATQDLTTVGNEQYQKLAVLASNMGTTNDAVNDTVRDSISLSTQFIEFGLTQETAIKGLALAREGDYTQLQRYIPALKEANTAAEKQAILTEGAARGWDMAQKNAESYRGRIDQMKNAYGDLQEAIGGQILTGLFDAEEGGNIVDSIKKIIKIFEKTGFITKYIEQMKEQAGLIIKPFEEMFNIFNSVAQSMGFAGDKGDTLTLIFDVLMWIIKALQVPMRAVWEVIETVISSIGFWIDVMLGKKGINDVLGFYREAIINLVSPITDLLGLTDKLTDAMGGTSDSTAAAAKAANNAGVDFSNLSKDLEDVTEKTGILGTKFNKLKDDLDAFHKAEAAAAKALEENNKKYQAFAKVQFAINQEAKKNKQLTTDINEQRAIEVQRLEDIMKATDTFFSEGGYTRGEIEKLKELQKGLQAASYQQIEQIDDTTDAYLDSYDADIVNVDNYLKTKEDLNKEANAEFLKDQEETAAKKTEMDLEAIEAGIAADQVAADKKKFLLEQSIKVAGDLLQASLDYELAQNEGNEEKQKEIRKKYAAAQAAISIAEIGINTAQAVSETVAELGGIGAITPLGVALIAGIIGTGVAQAALVATNASKIAGFADGGYTGDGGKYDEAGTVHKGEDVWSKRDVALSGGIKIVESMRPTSPTFGQYFNGGAVGFSETGTSSNGEFKADTRPIVVTVEDINAGVSRENRRASIANSI